MKKHKIRGIAYVLTLCVTLGAIPNMPGNVSKAAAESQEISVTGYAAKEQLMNSFDLDGKDDTVGKIVFGKNSNGSAQEWYIAGKDEGVSGDNTILFAASAIATGQNIDPIWYAEKKVYDTTLDCNYASGTEPEWVYPNHYGASNLRAALKEAASDTAYFTKAQQGLMNTTTVTTEDLLNDTTYTTSDKLYGLMADYYADNGIIMVGSNNQKEVAYDYWGENGDPLFWLRSPYTRSGDGALYVVPGMFVNFTTTDREGAARPAFNLNLSSVLFASAAPTASVEEVSGQISTGSAMSLRVDGNKRVRSYFNSNPDTVEVQPVSGEKVNLVIQGNDGTTDWYFSKAISGTDSATVTAEQVKSACESFLSENPDFSNCKIWLEKDIDGLTYAKTVQGETEVILWGDADGNGQITAEDALSILKQVVGIEQESYVAELADVDGNTEITAEDALAVLKHVVGSELIN